MAGDEWIAGALARAARACTDTADKLRAAGVATEHLASVIPPRRVLLWTRPARMEPLGTVWRIGPLLLDAEGHLYAAGQTTRAAERGRPSYQSESREERREIAAAALRGGFPAGTPVNFDAVPLPLTEGLLEAADGAEWPIGLSGHEVRVRWRPGASLEGAQTLAAFLQDRAALLRDPTPE